MRWSFFDDVWKMWRDAPGFFQPLPGHVQRRRQNHQGYWEKSFDGSKWEHDFDLDVTKVR